LVERIDSAFTEALAELDRSLQLGNSLAGVIRLLAHMQNQQRKMVETTQIEPESTATDLPTDGASLSSDFEMF
jgi:hypothetical protein